MWKCNECGAVFDEPCVEEDDPSPSGISLPAGTYKYYSCPYCPSEDIEEFDDEEEPEEEEDE